MNEDLSKPWPEDVSWVPSEYGIADEFVGSHLCAVDGLVCGPFGIHGPDQRLVGENPYTLTHLRSGAYCGRYGTEEQAKTAARKLSGVVDFNAHDTPASLFSSTPKEELFSLIMECGADYPTNKEDDT